MERSYHWTSSWYLRIKSFAEITLIGFRSGFPEEFLNYDEVGESSSMTTRAYNSEPLTPPAV